MRKIIQLQDCELPSFHWSVTAGGQGGKKEYGFNTDYKTAKVQIQTVIVNGNKESFACQIDQRIMASELNAKSKSKKHQQGTQGGQEQGEGTNNKAQTNAQQQEGHQAQLSQETQKKLDRFMRKVTPLMDKQINENLPLYSNFGIGQQKRYFKKQTRLTYTLQNLDKSSQDGLIVADVAWNSTGVMVAAGYCKGEHDSTCSHKSMICLWSMFKRNFKPTKPQVIYTNNCINCIEFHPKRPSVFVVGNYIGEILLYDLTQKTQPLIGKTMVDEYFHRDVISQLNWWPFKSPGKSETSYNVLSLSTDGRILLWDVPNAVLGEQAQQQSAAKLKSLFKNPIKGFSILRKKQGVVIPVSALSMKQSKANRNVFVIGSEGGSILKASLTNVSHFINTEGKILLDMQQTTKFKKEVYPFLLNVPSKQFRQLKQYLQKFAKQRKMQQITTVQQILSLQPKITLLYPNSITFAYEPLSYPISSLSFNRYGLFIANGCDGYSRLYLQNRKQNLESFQEGYQWGWVDEGTKIGGFIGQQFVVVDWIKGTTIWSVPVGEALKWKQSNSNSIAIISQGTKIKIIELGDRVLKDDDNFNELFAERLAQLTESNNSA